VQSIEKGFWDHFALREDRLLVDGFIIASLGGLALASTVCLPLSSSPARQHAYVDWFFEPVAAAPVLVFFLVFGLRTWIKRRKASFPAPGS
jgi:hypothetical protein